jgi:hypothetical protein
VPIYHNRPTFAFLCLPPSPTSRLVLPRSRAKVPCVCGGGRGLARCVYILYGLLVRRLSAGWGRGGGTKVKRQINASGRHVVIVCVRMSRTRFLDITTRSSKANNDLPRQVFLCAYGWSYLLTRAQRTRVYFCPQHWPLCHLGLY